MVERSIKKKILIVDDIPENIRILMEILKDDYVVVAAINGEKALKMATSDPVPDVILLDIMMPGMDGYEVCRRLKADQKARAIPVIFVTAKSEAKDEIKGLSLGAVDYITKPISPPRVEARIKSHLALRGAQKKLEEQNKELIEAAKLKEDVDNIVRHDLKAPLSSIIGLPQMLLENKTLGPENEEFLKMIEESGYRMLNMINLSLDLFKMERGMYRFQPVQVDMVKLVAKIVAENQGLAEAKRIKIKTMVQGQSEGGSATFDVLGEELLCYSMLANLVKNTMEASPEGEPVSIFLEGNEQGHIHIHNQGIVPNDIRDTFFGKYATCGKSGGTGLGTYSAKLIAETQGGEIRMVTSQTEGTTVSVILPLAGAGDPIAIEGDRPDRISVQAQRKAEIQRPLHVLLVDDDDDNQRILTRQLAHSQISLASAGNGREALEKMKSMDYDVVFMDMEMPVMDGLTAARSIRKWEQATGKRQQAARHIPIVAMTAHDDEKTKNRCREAGFTDYVVKPADSATLWGILAGICNPAAEIEPGPKTVPNEDTETAAAPKPADWSESYIVAIDADLEDLIPSFLDNKIADTAKMRQALKDKEFETVRRISHKLKGSLNMYGFGAMSDLCADIEAAATMQKAAAIEANLDRLETYFDKIEISYAANP